MIVPRSATPDVQEAFRQLDTRLSQIDAGRNWDVHGRRVINAGAAVDETDYMIKTDVQTLLDALAVTFRAELTARISDQVDLIVRGRLTVGQQTLSSLGQITATSVTRAQLALKWDALNYQTLTVGSTGILTVSATGTNPRITLLPGGGTVTAELRVGYDAGTNFAKFTVTSTGLLTIANNGTNPNIAIVPNGTGSLVLTSGVVTGTTTTAGVALAANSLTTGTGFYAASSTLTSGKLMDLQVSGTAAGASQTGLNILTTGANAGAGLTTYGAQISNTHSTNTSTNVALYLNASGGATANYGLIVNAGTVGIGTSTPTETLHVVGNGRFSTTLGVGGAAPAQGLSVTGAGTTSTMVQQWNVFSGVGAQLRAGTDAQPDFGTNTNHALFLMSNSVRTVAVDANQDVRVLQNSVVPVTIVNSGALVDTIVVKAGVVKIGGSAVRATTEGTNHLDIFNGTAPVSTLTNGISLYTTAGELRVMDAAGNATLLSPHDPVTNEWIYESVVTTTGKRLRIDMERLMRRLDASFGGGYIHG